MSKGPGILCGGYDLLNNLVTRSWAGHSPRQYIIMHRVSPPVTKNVRTPLTRNIKRHATYTGPMQVSVLTLSIFADKITGLISAGSPCILILNIGTLATARSLSTL